MEIVENSKQMEFLMKIRDVGMMMVFRKANSGVVMMSFAPFVDYIKDEDILYKFAHSVAKLDNDIEVGIATPDSLLLELGQYTPYIIYDDEEEEENSRLYDVDDSWLYN